MTVKGIISGGSLSCCQSLLQGSQLMRQSTKDRTRQLACLANSCARSEEMMLFLAVNQEEWTACQEIKPSIRSLSPRSGPGA